MPQGRRKVPFSGKAKKEQLKAKKQHASSKLTTACSGLRSGFLASTSDDDDSNRGGEALRLQQPHHYHHASKRGPVNRYALQFRRQTDAEVKEQRELAHRPIVSLLAEDAAGLEEEEDFFEPGLDFPRRPPWSYEMSLDLLEARENKYFKEYLDNLDKQFGLENLSYFELNLETWRQLWRVLEMSDILLLIVDIRYPSLMFPPSLYEHVTQTLRKHMILILNKIDLAPAPLVAAWMAYFRAKHPDLHVVPFTSLPSYNLVGSGSDSQRRRRRGRLRMAAEGTQALLDKCRELLGKEAIDWGPWQSKLREEMENEEDDEGDEDGGVEIGETIEVKQPDCSFYQHETMCKNGVLTLGCVGQPNAGKSSLMNALMGRKVVSVSRTPGHTKHFQTIFLTGNVRLCDCPGLVFPSRVPRVLQVLMGSYPVAQLREPFSAVGYLAARLDLPRLLRLQHPQDEEEAWSAMDVCEAWARKRGYVTAKAGRLDAHRAANSLLRMALEGRIICLCLRPPRYSEQKALFEQHPDVEMVKWIQARTAAAAAADEEETAAASSCAAAEGGGGRGGGTGSSSSGHSHHHHHYHHQQQQHKRRLDLLLLSSDDEFRHQMVQQQQQQQQRIYEPSSREDESSDESDDSPISFGTNKFAALNATEG